MVYVLFVLGFLFLIKGADFLVDGASSLAKRFSVSDVIIGLTVVALGTTAPEFVVNVISSVSGNSSLVLGNVFGSCIANILLVLGVAALLYPLKIHKRVIFEEIPIGFVGVILVAIMIYIGFWYGGGIDSLVRVEGIILLALFFLFVRYIFKTFKKTGDLPIDLDVKPMRTWKSILFIIVGLAGLILGGEWVVHGAVSIATSLGWSQSVIGLTIVAFGTSLPELTTAVVAMYKRKSDIAIGNVVGANIFNIFWVLGTSAVIAPISIYSAISRDILMVLFVNLLLFVFVLSGKKFILQRYQGGIMVALYICYLIMIFLSAD